MAGEEAGQCGRREQRLSGVVGDGSCSSLTRLWKKLLPDLPSEGNSRSEPSQHSEAR